MPLAISIAVIQQLSFLSFMFESSFFTKTASDDSRALMFAVALLTAFLSVPSIAWNFTLSNGGKNKKNVLSVVISVATLLFGIVYMAFAFGQRAHIIGVAFF